MQGSRVAWELAISLHVAANHGRQQPVVGLHVGVTHSVTACCVGVQAHVRFIDALYASGKFVEAAAALHEAVAKDHTFKTIPEYKVGGAS